MHTPTTNTTAILVFARSAKEELVSRSYLGPSTKKDTAIVQLFIEKTLQEIAKSSFPNFLIRSKNQSGASFGERLINSFQEIFDKGFERVIAVGIDTPALQSIDLLNAHTALLSNDLVLGPDKRGGCYLIGINKKAFLSEPLKVLAYQSNDVLNSYLSFSAQHNCTIHVLESYRGDIHTINDIFHELKTKVLDHRLRFLLINLISPLLAFFPYQPKKKRKFNINSLLLRGPPQWSF